MTLDAIRCFCAVVDHGSFRLAGEAVHRSQPAVTQQIQGLEREFGQILLDRKTCTPTAAGLVIYERGSKLLLVAEGLHSEIADFEESDARELVVGTSDTNALYFLPEHVSAFARAMPRTHLVVHCRSSDAVADGVQRGELDLGIVTLPTDREALETRQLFEQRLILAAPKAHPLAKQQRTSLSKLHGETFVLMHEDTRTGRLLRDYFRRRGFDPQVVMDSGSFEVIKQYVASGVGLSIIPEMVLRPHDRRAIAALSLAGLPRVAIGAIWRKDAYQTKAARAFLEEISPSVRRGPPSKARTARRTSSRGSRDKPRRRDLSR